MRNSSSILLILLVFLTHASCLKSTHKDPEDESSGTAPLIGGSGSANPRDPARIDWNPCTKKPADAKVSSLNGGTIGYARDIKSIIDTNCVSCHPQFAAFSGVAQKGRMINTRVNLPPSDEKAMPKGRASLNQDELNLLKAWQIADFPNEPAPIPAETPAPGC